MGFQTDQCLGFSGIVFTKIFDVENGGAHQMIPLIFNPIYTFYSGVLGPILPALHPKGFPTIFPMRIDAQTPNPSPPDILSRCGVMVHHLRSQGCETCKPLFGIRLGSSNKNLQKWVKTTGKTYCPNNPCMVYHTYTFIIKINPNAGNI